MYTYSRKVQYHETDKMGITHHANYIKWMEEARIAFLDAIGLPFSSIEALGIVSPVTGIALDYKNPTTFGDEIQVEVGIQKYSPVKLEVGYTMKNVKTGAVAAVGSSKHCFLKDGRIVSLKRENEAMHALLMAQAEERT